MTITGSPSASPTQVSSVAGPAIRIRAMWVLADLWKGCRFARSQGLAPAGLPFAYDALQSWIRDNGCEPSGDPWEVYFSDPVSEPDPATRRTYIYAPYTKRYAPYTKR
jgi:hypothetical protein